MALPTVTFDETKTIIPRKSYIKFTPVVAGVDGTAVELIGKVAKYDSEFQRVERKVPDSTGLLRPDRIEVIEQNESISFEVEDVNLLTDLFGSLAGSFKTGRAQLWVVDPDDESTKVAVKSNDFKCFCEMEGGLDFSAGVVSKATLKFTALEKVTLSAAATA
jgi:hypothetical protein